MRIPSIPFAGLALSITLALALAAPVHAQPQSTSPSQASAASLEASVEMPVAIVGALSAGAEFVVAGVQASGETVAITLSAVGTGASMVVHLSAEAARRLGIVAGTAISVAAVGTGWILSAAGEALCFIAHPDVRRHVHSARIGA